MFYQLSKLNPLLIKVAMSYWTEIHISTVQICTRTNITHAIVDMLYFHLDTCQTVANSGTGLKQLCIVRIYKQIFTRFYCHNLSTELGYHVLKESCNSAGTVFLCVISSNINGKKL